MNESWHAVTVDVPSAQAEFAGHLLYLLGSNGVVEETSNDANAARLTAYFKVTDEPRHSLANRVKEMFSKFSDLADVKLSVITAAQNDWKEKWRQWFKPFEIVPGIVVTPSWEKYEAKGNEKIITLDPGMAFGTGLHETTRLCAEAIFSFSDQVRAKSLLDVGTGSGLLAILAKKLGVRTVAAVENDLDALQIAKENIELNHAGPIDTRDSLGKISGTYDIVVANILLMTLIELKEMLVARLNRNGILIMSGITLDQEKKLVGSYLPTKCIETKQMGEWSCVICRSSS